MSLCLPKNTQSEMVINLLNTLYPDKEFEIHATNGKKYFLPKGFWSSAKKTAIDLTGGFLQPGMSFELIEHERFVEIVPNVDPELFDISDPCELLSVQFFSDDLFDPLEIIPHSDWEEYFRAVAAMIKEEWSTGTEKVTKIAEKYVEIAFGLIVNDVFAGRQGIVEIRSKAQSAHTWFQRVEVINQIPKKIKGVTREEKDIIRRLVTGYTLLRQLRNKSHHPGEVEITYSDMMVSLSTMILVHNELLDLLELLGITLIRGG